MKVEQTVKEHTSAKYAADPDQFRNFQRLEGGVIKLGPTVLKIPALNWRALKELKEELKLIQQGFSLSAEPEYVEAYMAAVTAVVHAALERNYPHITREFIEEYVDLRNVGDVTLVVMGLSGFTKEAAEQQVEGTPSGE